MNKMKIRGMRIRDKDWFFLREMKMKYGLTAWRVVRDSFQLLREKLLEEHIKTKESETNGE